MESAVIHQLHFFNSPNTISESKMKLIFFLTLSVISTCSSYTPARDEFEVLDTTHYVLSLQKHQTETQILTALSICNKTFKAPFEESLQLFQNPPTGAMQITNRPGKCVMDCVLRTVGVVSALKYLNL